MSFSAENSEQETRAVKVWFSGEFICVKLTDGREVKAPLEFYPRLLKATETQRNNFELSSYGHAIHWPDVDEDLSVEGIVLGRRAII